MCLNLLETARFSCKSLAVSEVIGPYTRGLFQIVDREESQSRMGEEQAGLDL